MFVINITFQQCRPHPYPPRHPCHHYCHCHLYPTVLAIVILIYLVPFWFVSIVCPTVDNPQQKGERNVLSWFYGVFVFILFSATGFTEVWIKHLCVCNVGQAAIAQRLETYQGKLSHILLQLPTWISAFTLEKLSLERRHWTKWVGMWM